MPAFTYLICVLAPLSGHFSLKLQRNVQQGMYNSVPKKVHRGTYYFETRLRNYYVYEFVRPKVCGAYCAGEDLPICSLLFIQS